MLTADEIKAKYWALEVLASGNQADMGNISGSLETSKIDMNPHQIEAALFALKSPLSQGVILADEVGLGKTIEAGKLLFWWSLRPAFANNGKQKCRKSLVYRLKLLI